MNKYMDKYLKEATDVLWDICKGKERCPRQKIRGQLRWYAKKVNEQMKRDYEQQLKDLRTLRANEFANEVIKRLEVED